MRTTFFFLIIWVKLEARRLDEYVGLISKVLISTERNNSNVDIKMMVRMSKFTGCQNGTFSSLSQIAMTSISLRETMGYASLAIAVGRQLRTWLCLCHFQWDTGDKKGLLLQFSSQTTYIVTL